MAKIDFSDEFSDDIYEQRAKSKHIARSRVHSKQNVQNNAKQQLTKGSQTDNSDTQAILKGDKHIEFAQLTSDSEYGTVLEIHRGRYLVDFYGVDVWAARKKILLHTSIVPGDKVQLNLNKSDITDNYNSSITYRIEKIYQRSSIFRRTADDTKNTPKVIAANIDQVALILSTCTPDIQLNFVQRIVKATEHESVKLAIIWTKTDLKTVDTAISELANSVQDELTKMLADINVAQFDAQSELPEIIQNFEAYNTVLVGLSGAGKSTLINRIFPEACRITNEVSGNGDGRHTSTSSATFKLTTDNKNTHTIVIDTPGIRSFGLGHISE